MLVHEPVEPDENKVTQACGAGKQLVRKQPCAVELDPAELVRPQHSTIH